MSSATMVDTTLFVFGGCVDPGVTTICFDHADDLCVSYVLSSSPSRVVMLALGTPGAFNNLQPLVCSLLLRGEQVVDQPGAGQRHDADLVSRERTRQVGCRLGPPRDCLDGGGGGGGRGVDDSLV